MPQKSLEQVLQGIYHVHLQGPPPAEVLISSLVSDSRKATPGSLFIAVAGEKQDGHAHVASAIDAGCPAVLVEQGRGDLGMSVQSGVCVVAVQDSRAALGKVAAAFYAFPGRSLHFIGITGTNGKTTVTYLLEKILADQGRKIGVIGTVNYRYTDRAGARHHFPAPFTTPDPVILQEMLRQMVDAGVETVLMEVSSHALAQQRIGGIRYDIAVFTNLSHDHLDYHPSMDDYFAAKTLLFSDHLQDGGKAIVTFKDSDDPGANRWPSALQVFLQSRGIDYVTCGSEENSIVAPTAISVEIDRTRLALRTRQGDFSFVSPLVGRFNADNIMTALAVADLLQVDLAAAVNSLGDAAGAPGRLERVTLADEMVCATVFVDYAHSPDALLNILHTLKGVPHRRLICVFGCGGDRDSAKRPQMGRIAARLADVAIVTDDNPRSESSEHIIAQILAGVREEQVEERTVEWLSRTEAGRGFLVIPDRRLAIRTAIHGAATDDVVVVAGKGHEKYQLTSRGKRFFDDCLEVREAMLMWKTADVGKALATGSEAGHRSFSGICTDSRKIEQGQLFVALQGDKFDGHDFLERVVADGAGGLIVSDPSRIAKECAVPVFTVADTLTALGDLAAYRRRRLARLAAPLVVGITGSTGKTSVKEMTARIFEQQWPDSPEAPEGRVLRTGGNFNNLVGLPLSLLPLQLKHRVAVLEMGMNQPGEIARLATIADPDISCIVNVHGAHLQGVGSIEGVAREKGELFRMTGPQGLLIVNLDDPHVRQAAQRSAQRQLGWSMDEDRRAEADIFASAVHAGEDGNISFTLHLPGQSHDVHLQVPGRHNVANALAAAAIAHGAGIAGELIVRGLQSFSSAAGRLQVVRARHGYAILNDTYNANPASMAAGLSALASMKADCRIAILADMLELGEASEEAHRQVGSVAAASGLGYLLVTGSFADKIAEGARTAGMDAAKIVIFTDKKDISPWILQREREQVLTPESRLLVKASRGMRLETVVEQLVADEP